MSGPRSRVTRQGSVAPADLVANPRNWRQHPRHQREALRDLLGKVGWVQGVVINERTGLLVDGHLRAELALEEGADALPATWVDLSEEEERLVLAALDPLGALAVADSSALAELLGSLELGDDELSGLLEDLGNSFAVAGTGNGEAPGDLPDETAFWPYIRLQVSRETLRAFEQWWPARDGETDDAKVRALIGG